MKSPTLPVLNGDPIVGFRDARTFAAWLEKSHASSPAIWLKIAKKDSGESSPSYAEALDAALAWGWIDGQKQKLDDAFYLQRFTRRGKRSAWSQVNRDKVAALIASGAMRPPGLAEVERAKADGRWEAAYAPQSKATVPPDLEAALGADAKAKAAWAALDSANRYAILYRVQSVKKPETRARKITEFVAMLARGERLHEPVKKAAAKK